MSFWAVIFGLLGAISVCAASFFNDRILKQTYLVSDLLCDLKKIEDEFDSKVGIPNANTDKRERLISDEVNANNAEVSIIASGWLDHIRTGLDQIRQMYGEQIIVDWRYPQDVADYADSKQSQPLDNRTL